MIACHGIPSCTLLDHNPWFFLFLVNAGFCSWMQASATDCLLSSNGLIVQVAALLLRTIALVLYSTELVCLGSFVASA